MRKQGSLKGEGTHRGNLSVTDFAVNLALKDIQRKIETFIISFKYPSMAKIW